MNGEQIDVAKAVKPWAPETYRSSVYQLSRLDAPDDRVGNEIESALAAQIPVYPVLVEGTAMPRVDELPEPPSTAVKIQRGSAERRLLEC